MKHCGTQRLEMERLILLRSDDWNNQGICDACYYALLKSER